MNDLIEAIKADLVANLPYLKWVEAIDNELLPPDGVEFPGVGIKDGDESFQSLPSKRDLDQPTLLVVAYQSLTLATPGAAIMGETASLGDAGKGLIEIAKEIRARLNDNRFTTAFGETILWAHIDAIAASETIGNEETGLLIQLKRITVTYRRFS